MNLMGIGRPRVRGRGPASITLRRIPSDLWETVKRRQLADSEKVGRWLNQEEILLDLIRQYAEAVTYFGKKHIRQPSPALPPPLPTPKEKPRKR
jgi:hypothetical protein